MSTDTPRPEREQPPVGPRCLHIYPDGTQCSLPAVTHEEVPGLAGRHAYPPTPEGDPR